MSDQRDQAGWLTPTTAAEAPAAQKKLGVARKLSKRRGIFLSYRRADTMSASGRIYERLAKRYGKQHVYTDVDSLPGGADFAQLIQQTVAQSAVTLVVIGQRWLDSHDDTGNRSIDDPTDVVRREVETAFEQRVAVLPVIVEGAHVPKAEDLPESLQRLPSLTAIVVNDDPDFEAGVRWLIKQVDPLLPPGMRPQVRCRRALAGVAAVLAASLVIVGFVAVLAPRLRLPSVASTPTAQPSVSPQPTGTTIPQPTGTTIPQPTGTTIPQPTGTTLPQPGAFVCANPPGSSMTYAYIRGDRTVYSVTGCATPKRLAEIGAIPIAWSPSNRYLAVSLQTWPAASPVEAIDAQTGAQVPTGFDEDFGSGPTVGSTARIFFGWLDDNTVLGAIAPLVDGPDYTEAPGTATLVRVDLRTGKETTIGTIPGWVTFGSYRPGATVRIVANGHYLFYAAYEGSTAYLHRFDLAAGVDTKLVSLGLYGNGGCQGTTVCGWSAPWDVSPDGGHILYHRPGPTSTPSDISTPKDTPVVYANPDGSGASTPFGAQLAAGLVTPVFSPSGALAVTTGSTYASADPVSGTPQMKFVAFGGPATIVPGSLNSWRGDNRALVVFDTQAGDHSQYDLGTGKTTPLEANSVDYVWGN